MTADGRTARGAGRARGSTLARAMVTLALGAGCLVAPAQAQRTAEGSLSARPYVHTYAPPGGGVEVHGGGGLEVAWVGPRGLAWMVDLSYADATDGTRVNGGFDLWSLTVGLEQTWLRAATPLWDAVATAGAGFGARALAYRADPLAFRETGGRFVLEPQDGELHAAPLGFVSGGVGLSNGRLGFQLVAQAVAADWSGLVRRGAREPPSATALRLRAALTLQP